MRDNLIATLKSTIEYILEDISDDQLLGMVALVTKEAEKVARMRHEEKLQTSMQAEQERYRNMMPFIPPQQTVVGSGLGVR